MTYCTSIHPWSLTSGVGRVDIPELGVSFLVKKEMSGAGKMVVVADDSNTHDSPGNPLSLRSLNFSSLLSIVHVELVGANASESAWADAHALE